METTKLIYNFHRTKAIVNRSEMWMKHRQWKLCFRVFSAESFPHFCSKCNYIRDVFTLHSTVFVSKIKGNKANKWIIFPKGPSIFYWLKLFNLWLLLMEKIVMVLLKQQYFIFFIFIYIFINNIVLLKSILTLNIVTAYNIVIRFQNVLKWTKCTIISVTPSSANNEPYLNNLLYVPNLIHVFEACLSVNLLR